MTEYTTSIGVRYGDLDTMGHVNNAVYARYIEQARGDYFEDVVGVGLAEIDTVIVTMTIDFLRPIDPDDEVEVGVEVTDVGESSVTMAYEVRTGRGVVAEAETVQVAFDRETESSRPLPDEWREAIESYHGL